MTLVFRPLLVPLLAWLVPGALLPALAAPPPLAVSASADQSNPDAEASTSVFLGDLQRSNFLLGDMFGLRGALAQAGMSLAVQETSELLGNATGGVRRGFAYDGLTQAILQLDTQRAGGWYGGLLNVSALQLHGRNFSQDTLLVLQPVSGVEDNRATRLWEAWFDQKFLDEDRLDIRVGEQSVDQEFMLDPNGAVFLNSAFGWPMVSAYDLPGGGPAAPLAALGGRVRYRPVDSLNILLGAFSGNPAPSAQGDPQLRNPSGISFPTNGGVFLIAELQYSYPAIGSMVEPGEGRPLGYTYRVGAWYDSGRVALPNASGQVVQHLGDMGAYALADRMVWQNEDHPNQNISVFTRVVGAPQSDRTLIDISIDGGLVYHNPIISRPDDSVGLGVGYVHASRKVGGGSETFVETTYQLQIAPWWQVQPDVQVVFSPGGGIVTRHVSDELVFGLRTNVLF